MASPATARAGRVDYSETDLRVPAPGVPFDFVRHHNTRTHLMGPFALGWSHSYHWPLKLESDGDVTVLTPKLVPVRFDKQADGTFVAPSSARGFELTTSPDGLFHLKQARLTYNYNSSRLLTSIVEPGGLTTSLSYSPLTTDTLWGALVKKITDSVGRTYTLTWVAVSDNDMAMINYPAGNYHKIRFLRQDATGRVISYNDHAGQWESSNLALISVSDTAYATGQFRSYGYHHTFDALSVLDRDGRRVYEFTYDVTDTLASYVYRDEPQVTYERHVDDGYVLATKAGSTKRTDFTSDNRALSQTEFDGTSTEYTWDEQTGELTQAVVTDPMGNVTTTTYQTGGCSCTDVKPVTIVDSLGGITSFQYDSRGNRTRKTDPLGRVTTWEYDSADRLLSTTDAAGNRTVYTYNGLGLVASRTDALDHTTVYGYNSLGQLVRTTDPEGGVTEYEYDDGGFVTRVVSPGGSEDIYVRDLAGRILSHSDPTGNVTTYAYNGNDQVVSETDPLGRVRSYSYTTNSSKLASAGLGFGGVGLPYGGFSRSYDQYGNMTYTSLDDYLNHVYDNRHRLLYTLNAGGTKGAVVYSHDAAGRTTGVREVAGFTSGDPTTMDGPLTRFQYDALGRRTHVEYPDGATITMTYDLAGNLTSDSDPYGHVTTYAYDAMDRRIRRSDPMGRVTTWAYDAMGRRTRETDPGGHVNLFFYDGLGRLVSTSNAMGAVTTFSYNADGDLTAIHDARGETWSFQYDAAHRLVAESTPLGHSTTYAYDEAGNLVERRDGRGQLTVSSYDPGNRLVGVSYADGTTVTASYTNLGERSSVSVVGGYYEAFGWANRRFTGLSDNNGAKMTAYYGDHRRRTRVNYGPYSSDLPQYLYSYDSRGRLVRLEAEYSQGQSQVTSYEFGLRSELTRVSRSNGVVTTYAYNAAGEVTSIRHTRGATTLSFFEYEYDGEGLRVGRTSNIGQESYQYDDAHRLVVSERPTETETFAYDEVGNLLAISNASGLRLFAYDADNRLVSETGDTPATYTFDANGNMSSRVTTGSTQVYTWDSRDKLREVSVDGTLVTSFEYHPLSDLMLKRKVPGTYDQYTLWFGENPGVDYDMTGGSNSTLIPKVHFAALDDYDRIESAYSTEHSTALVPLRDALQSVYQLTTTTGAIAAAYDYSAYGEPRNWQDPIGNRFTYTGREWDEEAGLYYYRARWYRPEIARFQNVDPLLVERRSGVSTYQYVRGNPVSLVDPLGTCPPACLALICGALVCIQGCEPCNPLRYNEYLQGQACQDWKATRPHYDCATKQWYCYGSTTKSCPPPPAPPGCPSGCGVTPICP